MPAADWLMLHGVPLQGMVWREVARNLMEGEGSHPDLVLDTQPEALQFRCAQALARTLEVSQRMVDLVGHSFGAQVAVELALMLPNQVRSLVVLCSRDRPFSAFAALAQGLRSCTPFDVGATLGRWFRPEELRADSTAVQSARRSLSTLDRPTYAAALDSIAGWDRTADRGHLIFPVTLVAAELDPVASPAVMREWALGLRNARFLSLPGSAHMSVFTRPAELAALLREHRAWVEGQEAVGPA